MDEAAAKPALWCLAVHSVFDMFLAFMIHYSFISIARLPVLMPTVFCLLICLALLFFITNSHHVVNAVNNIRRVTLTENTSDHCKQQNK